MNTLSKNPMTRSGLFLAVTLLTTSVALSQNARTLPTPAAPAVVPADENPAPTPAVKPPKPISRGGGSGRYGLETAENNGRYGSGRYGGDTAETFGGYGGGFGSTALYRSASARETVPPILIQFAETDPVLAQHLEEDLTIMSHILDQALERGLGEETPPSKMGVPLIYTSGSRSSRALYIAGTGPVFMIKVNMPLLPAPALTEPKAESAADSEWESARREVFEGGGRNQTVTITVSAPDVRYDGEQVEALQQTLLGALKNAANIRGLKPDENITISVFGQPMPVVNMNVAVEKTADQEHATSSNNGSKASSKSAKSSRKSSISVPANAVPPVTQRGTVLTMRVKVADVTPFAQGKATLDEFAKKVTTTTYAGAGYGISSINSWLQSGRAGNYIKY